MSTYAEKRFLPYTPAQPFELVAAVDRYPEFLPWCRAVRIRSSEKLKGTPDKTVIVAALVIGFRMIRERYTSRINLQPPHRIDVASVEGPFRYLDSHWTFEPVAPSAEHPRGGTMLTFRIRFELRSSELLAMVGPNGAGKTAMLNCINGIYRPDAGEILLDGRNIAGQPLHKMVELGVGRAFQHAELFPHLTVVENILTGRHCRFRAGLWRSGIYVGKARQEEIAERRQVELVIDFFELYRHRDTPVGALPYGIQKMVGVARALAMEPKLLLLDKPCTGLIREERENLARFLLRIGHEVGPTVIWVEHDMQMVSDLADRVVVLNHGAKIIEGALDVVRRAPEVIEAYLGHATAQ